MSFADRKMIIDDEEVTLHADGSCPVLEARIDIDGQPYHLERDTFTDDFGNRVHTQERTHKLAETRFC